MGVSGEDYSYRNASAREIEVRRCYLLARDGYVCTQKYGYGCGKTVEQLLFEAEQDEIRTGIPRQHPVLYQDHIDGNSQNPDGPNGEYCGNLQHQCPSCNKKKARRRSVSSSQRLTREKQDSIQIDDDFFSNLQVYLADNQHICYKEMLAIGQKWTKGGSSITIERHFEKERVTIANKDAKFRVFRFQCTSDLCNGDHVCFRGEIPDVILDEKRAEYEAEWQRQYGVDEDKWKHNTASFLKPWLSLEDYVNQKIKEYIYANTPTRTNRDA